MNSWKKGWPKVIEGAELESDVRNEHMYIRKDQTICLSVCPERSQDTKQRQCIG